MALNSKQLTVPYEDHMALYNAVTELVAAGADYSRSKGEQDALDKLQVVLDHINETRLSDKEVGTLGMRRDGSYDRVIYNGRVCDVLGNAPQLRKLWLLDRQTDTLITVSYDKIGFRT